MRMLKRYRAALLWICVLSIVYLAAAVVFAQQGKVVSSYGPTNIDMTFDQIRAARMAVKEQRTAYFDGDICMATKKGVNILERGSQMQFMAEFLELLDFPPAPKLDIYGELDESKVTPSEIGEKTLQRQGPMCFLPPCTVLYRQQHAQPQGRTFS